MKLAPRSATTASEIKELNKDIAELNKQYVAFVAAASGSPVFLLIPIYGVVIAVADATTFAVMAEKVRHRIDDLRRQGEQIAKDKIQKLALVHVLENFNASVEHVHDEGDIFLDAIGTMAAGWSAFQTQIETRLLALTPEKLEQWGQFIDELQFRAAKQGWELIEAKAESFFQTGFVTFSPEPQS